MNPAPPASGFTLVEAIIVIAITGIIGAIIAVFVKLPVENYIDSSARAELSDIADTAVRRMAREVRLAVPNSIRVSGNSLEFVPTKTGGRYLAAEDGATGEHLDFEDGTNKDFQIVGPIPAGRQQIVAGDFIVVNNLNGAPDAATGEASGNVYANGTQQNRAAVASVSAAGVVSMTSNPFAFQVPSLPHPMHRFRVATQPITYSCSGGSLWRTTNYGFNTFQVAVPASPNQNKVMLASNVQSCAFQYIKLENTASSLLSLTLTLQNPSARDAPLTLTQQIHVDNTP